MAVRPITVVLLFGAVLAITLQIGLVIGVPVDSDGDFSAIYEADDEAGGEAVKKVNNNNNFEPIQSLQKNSDSGSNGGDARFFCKWCGGFSREGCRVACGALNYTMYRCSLCTCQCR